MILLYFRPNLVYHTLSRLKSGIIILIFAKLLKIRGILDIIEFITVFIKEFA